MLYIEKNPRNLSPGFDVTGTTEANTSAILHKRGLESTHMAPCLPTTGPHAYPPQDPMLTHHRTLCLPTTGPHAYPPKRK